MRSVWRWLWQPYTPDIERSGAIGPVTDPRPVYGDDGLRDQVSTAVAIAASSPEPRHLIGMWS